MMDSDSMGKWEELRTTYLLLSSVAFNTGCLGAVPGLLGGGWALLLLGLLVGGGSRHVWRQRVRSQSSW